MDYLIGGLLAAASAWHAGVLSFAGDRSFYSTILIVSATGHVATGHSAPVWETA